MKLNQLNNLYLSQQGDQIAVEELLPVAQKYSPNNPKILEIGCGYGRNLLALSKIAGSQVFGCDISQTELDKAQAKVQKYNLDNVTLNLQENNEELPYEDDQFDLVVLWQVLEHVPTREEKKKLLAEASRVLKNGGHLLIETPNQFFPIDYHDNNLPLVHWIFPDRIRQKITKIIRKKDYPPSQYLNLLELESILKESGICQQVQKMTRINFENNYWDIFPNIQGTRRVAKHFYFSLYGPIYFCLTALQLPGDLFSPSIRVVFQVKKALNIDKKAENAML